LILRGGSFEIVARRRTPRTGPLKVGDHAISKAPGFEDADRAPATGAKREFDVLIVTEPDGGYCVFVPELPSVATQGDTIEEARGNAQEAIEGYLEAMHADGLPIPKVHRDRVGIRPARIS
jgi:predicted RNase H-like HicB family nuclease